MFGLVVRFMLRPDAGAAFAALVAETVAKIGEEEPGTLVYAVHGVDGAPNERIFYELYRDRAAFEAHEATEHTKRFLAERQQYLAAPTKVDFLTLEATARPLPA